MPADEPPVGRAAAHRLRRSLLLTVAGIAAGLATAAPAASAHESGGTLESAGIAHPRAAGSSRAAVRLAAATGAEYGGALWRPASVWNYTDAARPQDVPITRIIIHVAEGGFASTYNWFASASAQSSAHYVVGKRGQVAQMVHERDIAWHAGNWAYNESSIGIEHEGYTRSGGFTEAQYRASARLAGHLARKYAIRPDRSRVIGHNQVPDPNHQGQWGGASHHTDPGRYWNWMRYMEYLRLYAGTTAQRTGDDRGAGFDAPGWSTASGGGSYDGGAHTAPPARGAEPARYRISLPSAGRYDVFARWPCRSDANPGTRITLATAGGDTTVRVNQRSRCANWVPLGTYEFSGGSAWRAQVSRRSGSAGTILADAIRFVRTGDAVDPATPAGLSVDTATSTGIDLRWGGSSDDIGVWGFLVSVDGGRVYAGAGHTFSLTGLPCGTDHTVRVRAIDLAGNRSPASTITAATAACPLPPSGLTQTAATTESITLTWTASPSAVALYLVSTPRWQRTTTATTLTKHGLSCGSVRTVFVRAQDAYGALSTPVKVSAATLPC